MWMVGPAEVTHLCQISDIDRQTDLSARTDNKRVSGVVANRPAPGFPMVIAEWPRNSRELVRVSLDRFNNRETIDIRSWWQDAEGDWRPGRSGLTLAVKHLPALADGLAEALGRARALGLVEAAPTNKDKTAAERQRRYRQRRNGVTP
jgi:transcriptional coactivator p15 (PC4)